MVFTVGAIQKIKAGKLVEMPLDENPYQLQLARPIRLGLLVIRLQEFGVGNELRIGRFSRDSLPPVRRRPRPGARAERTFPQSTMAENLLDHFRLATFDER